jgi:glutathione S-transferase
LISADFILCLAPEDREYFRRSREAAFGCTLEEYCNDRPRWLAKFGAVTAPLEATLKDQPFFSGATATHADYVLFSVFQYAQLGCSDEFVAEGTALRRWRDELARAFDGLGNRYPGHPAILA